VHNKKNRLHLGSPRAGPKVAAIASIVETCRRLNLNLRAYLTDGCPNWATGLATAWPS